MKGKIMTYKITYIEKGIPHDFKRIDTICKVTLSRAFRSGGLLYGYRDRFNIMSIAMEDIISMEEVK